MRFNPRRFAVAAVAAVAVAATAGCGSTTPYRGMEAENLFRLATEKYDEGEYDDAMRALDRLVVSFGTWGRIPEARLLLGHAAYANEDYLTARSEYLRFLDRFPGHEDAPEAAVGVCRCLVALSPHSQRDQGYTEDALTTCRNVVLDYPGTDQAQEAADLANRMRLKLAEKEYDTGMFYFRRDLYDSAIIYFEFVTDLYPETEFAPKALLGIYQANLEIGYSDLAEEARQRLLENYPDSEAAQEIRADNGGGAAGS